MIIKGNQYWFETEQGSKVQQLISYTRTFQRGVGWTTTQQWEGREAEMVGKGQQLSLDHQSVSVYRDGNSPLWKCEGTISGDPAVDPSDEKIEITYELVPNTLQQNNRLNPVAIAAVGGATSMKTLCFHLDQYRKNEPGYETQAGYRSKLTNAGLNADAITFFEDQINEREYFMNSQLVFRITRVFPPGSDYSADTSDDLGVGRIWNSSQINEWEQLSTAEGIYFGLPIGSWLKMAPSVTYVLTQRFQCVQEYWWGTDWSTLYYNNFDG